MNWLHRFLLKAKDIVEISMINVSIFLLLLLILFLQQLQIDLHALLDPVVGDRPPSYDSIFDFSLLNSHYKLPWLLPYPFFKIVQQLLSILTEIDINSLCFGLEDAVFIYQNESHTINDY